MTKRDAEHYQTHRDDPEEWGEASRPKIVRRRLASMVSVRFSPEEQDLVRAVAKRRQTSVSNFVRLATLKECGVTQPAGWVVHEAPHTVRDEWTSEGFQSGIVFWVAGQAGESKETLTIATS